MMDTVGRKFDLHNSRRPQLKSEQLKRHFLAEFSSGRFRPGDALPTENELAEMLSVSRKTVRNALCELDRDGFIRRIRGKGTFLSENIDVSAETKLELFALVVPESEGGHYPSLIQGFSRAATERHSLAIVNDTTNDLHKQATVILQLLSKRVGGVALVPTLAPTPASQITLLQQQGIPVVQCHRPVDGVQAPLLALRQSEVARLIGEKLIAAGHRRVARFHSARGPETDATLEQLRKMLGRVGGEIRDEDVYIGSGSVVHFYEQEGRIEEALRRMFARPDPPTAIATTFDTVAELVFLVLQRLGMRVPQDVSLMGFGGRDRSGAVIGRLTSVVMDGSEVGRMAYDLLDEMREGRRSIHNTERIDIPLDIYEGQTLGPPRSGLTWGVVRQDAP